MYNDNITMPERFQEYMNEEKIIEFTGKRKHVNIEPFGKQKLPGFGTIPTSFDQAKASIGGIAMANPFDVIRSNMQEQAKKQKELMRELTKKQQELAKKQQELRELQSLLNDQTAKLNYSKMQYSQVTSIITQLDITIIQQNNIIEEKNKQINELTIENTRLRNKQKSMKDDYKSFESLILGNDKASGYMDLVVAQQKINDNVREQEFSSYSPEETGVKEGFLKGGNLTIPINNLTSQINDTSNQIKNTSTQIKSIESERQDMDRRVTELNNKANELRKIIQDKEDLINKKTNHISYLMSENKKERNANNSILDNLLYYRSLLMGNTEVDGYKDIAVQQKIVNTTLKQQEIGSPIATDPQLSIPIPGPDEAVDAETITTEGFVSGTGATYNAVVSQNQIIENQIQKVQDDSTINNQLIIDYSKKRETMKFIHQILIFIFFGVFVFGCYKLYAADKMNIYVKAIIGVAMFLSIFIIHLIEYILLYSLPFISSLFIGTPYTPSTYWKIPGLHDYIP